MTFFKNIKELYKKKNYKKILVLGKLYYNFSMYR